MPALDLAQEELGHLTPEAMTEVATALELDPGYVEGVATFYSLFHLTPIGKHHFYVCTNLSCAIRGSAEIVRRFQEATGVKAPDEVTPDGLFSYEEVECLGACEYAPMMRLDQRFHYDLTPEKIDELIAERKEGRAPLSPSATPPRKRGGTAPPSPAATSRRERGGEAPPLTTTAPPSPAATPPRKRGGTTRKKKADG